MYNSQKIRIMHPLEEGATIVQDGEKGCHYDPKGVFCQGDARV